MSSATDRCRHIRRPDPLPLRGRWRIGCDCGFDAWADGQEGGRVLSGKEIETELERLFCEHLPPDERELYLLIDQRQIAVDDENGEPQMVARGNFLMPIGQPCVLTSWCEKDGVRWGRYFVAETGQTGELPVGEIRTADNRVFRLDCPA